MNERIRKLREQSLDAVPTISLERAELLTEFYNNNTEEYSIPVTRAMAFKYVMENKAICINDGELIVGERGPSPKATPTYPEICTHSLNDFKILNDREKVWFKADEKIYDIEKNAIIPFWSGNAIRDKIFESVDEAWKESYSAGVFTEFQEQRAPGHTVLDDKIYHNGFLDFKKKIEQTLSELDFDNDSEADCKKEELTAMSITCDAIMAFAERHADKLDQLSTNESDPTRKAELDEMTRICRKVPANKPETFWEALQYYWFVHLGVITELNTWDSFNPGRLDQHLMLFYRIGLADKTLTEEAARELLQSFWIKFNNQPAPPKVGVTAQESNTYTDFCLINVGGVKPTGEDAVNEMTYLILDVINEMRLLQPSSMVQISKKNPDRLVRKALDIIKTGYGQPSLFNTDAIIPEMLRQGKTIFDARSGGASGCVETGAFGKESYILTGYFNIPKVLEIALNNGVDPRTGKKIGIETGQLSDFDSFEQFYEAFEKQLEHFVEIKIRGNLIIEKIWSEQLPAPFLSVLVDDCIANGKDYNSGGARYNTSYIQGVGMGTITDSLTAIKYHIFDKKTTTADDFLNALQNNFDGHEFLHDSLLDETPP